MTTGIYALYWEEQDLIYIGLSQGIEGRFKEHLRDMVALKHSNYKVQNAFNSYGIPTLFILEKCLLEELNAKEIQWMQEFDALGKQGLCIVEGGQVGFGTNSAASKHSRRTILKVFSLLYQTTLPQIKIASRLRVVHHLVSDISKGTSHLWLKEAFPEKYPLMLGNNISRKANAASAVSLGRKYLPLMSPAGEVFYNIENVTDFCKKHHLLRHNPKVSMNGINRVLNSLRKSYKGWRLVS